MLTEERRKSIEQAMHQAGALPIIDVSWNEYSSTFESFVVDSKQRTVFVKFGISYTDPATGHHRGPARELGFHEHFAPSASYTPRLIASGVTDVGEEFVIFEYLKGVRLDHNSRSDVLERAIVALAQLHDALGSVEPPIETSNLFDRDHFEVWIGRIELMAPTWAHEHAWTLEARTGLRHVLARAAPGGIIHGELFANNVIIDSAGYPRFVDWDAWGRGPRALDLAALTLGWPKAPADWCLATYRSACASPAVIGPVTDLHAARVFYGLATLWNWHRRGLTADSAESWLQDAHSSWLALESMKARGGFS